MAAADPAPGSTGPLFPQLSGGRHDLSPAEVSRHQRARLEGAMIEAVSRHGFAGTTVSDLVSMAGVSKTTFYEHFDSRQACFLATLDSITVEVMKRVSTTFDEPGDSRESLTAALTTFVEIAIDEPAGASLVHVESLTLGRAGVASRERVSEALQVMVRQCFNQSPTSVAVSDLTLRAIVGGIRGVVSRRLRAEEADSLPGLVDDLVDWALSYQREPSRAARHAIAAAAEEPGAVARQDPPGEIPWEEPPDSALSRRLLTQRERIVRAAARVVVERGYEALSIPAISGAAGVSNQTFYEQFAGKRDAFVAAFEATNQDVLKLAGAAFSATGDRPEAVGRGIRTVLQYLAEHDLYAQLAFFELPTAGDEALDRGERALDGFSAFVHPDLAPTELARPISEVTQQAIAGGIWEAIQDEIVRGRRSSLPELAPQITWIALAPLSAGS